MNTVLKMLTKITCLKAKKLGLLCDEQSSFNCNKDRKFQCFTRLLFFHK